MTPFQALYGRPPPAIPSYTEGLSPVHEVDQQLMTRDELLQQLKINLASSVNRMKQMADLKRRDISFDIGKQVLLKLHPYRQQTVFKQVHHKLVSRFYGPYVILKKCGPVAYKLDLPEGTHIHPVFHVSLLKRYQENDELTEPQQTTLPPVSDKGVVALEPQKILDTHWVKQGGQLVEESLVQWKHLPPEDATWEQTMILNDKDPLRGGSIDRPCQSTRTRNPNPNYLG